MLERCKTNLLLIQESLTWLNEAPYFASTTCQVWGDSGCVEYEFQHTKIQCYLEYPMYEFAVFNFYPDKWKQKSFISDYELVICRVFPDIEPNAFDNILSGSTADSLRTMQQILRSMGELYLLRYGDHIEALWNIITKRRVEYRDEIS